MKRLLALIFALICVSPAYAADFRDYEPVQIFADNAADVSGDLTSGWMESPIDANGVLISCWIDATVPSTGITSSVQIPNDTDGGSVPVYGGGVTYVIGVANSNVGTQGHGFTIYPVATPISDLFGPTAGTGKKAGLPGKWRFFLDGAAGTDFTIDYCEALYLR